MSLATVLPPKPRMTLDDHRKLMAAVGSSRDVMDAFQNAAARTGFGTSNLIEGTAYPFNRLTFNYILLTSLFRGHWIIRKIVTAIADDMMKSGWAIISQASPKQLKEFDVAIDDTGTISKLLEALYWARLYGGSAAIVALKDNDNFEEPLDIDDVELDSYRGLIVLDRWSGIYPNLRVCSDINDPLSYGLPETYQVTTDTA